ncbi:MAG: nucleotidyltransferase family protein, partial [Pseudomonadota bacterium]
DVWLSAFAVGVKKQGDEWAVYAPYGLEDLFAMTIRPNKRQITQTVYESMVASYQQRWPAITVHAW